MAEHVEHRTAARQEAWPDLALPALGETSRTLHFWSQIVGKTRLALAPPMNHWWHVPLYVSARGLTTSPMASGGREVEIELDLVAHRLVLRASDCDLDTMPLEPGTLAQFSARYFDMLHRHGVEASIRPIAVEIPELVLLDRDQAPRAYDREAATRLFHAFVTAERIFEEFRGGFIGKASPVQLFWGSFDLAVTRYSGRRAPLHPGGAPHCPDYVMREAYSHEVSSAGFWPGDARYPQPAFYSYAYPEPAGFRDAPIAPAAARYLPELGELILPYAAVRAARDPEATLRAFLETSYAAAADLARWDRASLESPASRARVAPRRGIVALDPTLA